MSGIQIPDLRSISILRLSSDSEIEDNSDDGDAVLRRGIEFLLNGDRLGFAGLGKVRKIASGHACRKK